VGVFFHRKTHKMPEVTSREFEMSDPGTLSINQLKVSLIVVEAGKLIGVAVEPRNMRQDWRELFPISVGRSTSFLYRAAIRPSYVAKRLARR
jgi:hypothetical protein